MAAAVMSALVYPGPLLWPSCILGWALLCLAVIDWRHFILPDTLTLPLTAGGLLVPYLVGGDGMVDHAIGAAAGYLFVVSVAFVYRWLRKRDGIGMGDAKMLAAGGAWVSVWGLPTVVFYASVVGLGVVAFASLRGRPVTAAQAVPFGTFLALGTWLVWLFGPLFG